jgi:hypothetical protein
VSPRARVQGEGEAPPGLGGQAAPAGAHQLPGAWPVLGAQHPGAQAVALPAPEVAFDHAWVWARLGWRRVGSSRQTCAVEYIANNSATSAATGRRSAKRAVRMSSKAACGPWGLLDSPVTFATGPASAHGARGCWTASPACLCGWLIAAEHVDGGHTAVRAAGHP